MHVGRGRGQINGNPAYNKSQLNKATYAMQQGYQCGGLPENKHNTEPGHNATNNTAFSLTDRWVLATYMINTVLLFHTFEASHENKKK